MADTNGVMFTDEQLAEMSAITDLDIAIAAKEIERLMSPQFKNLLLALPDDLDSDAATNEP